MVMLMNYTAYFDESYNQSDKNHPYKPRAYTIACCVGINRQWIKFQKKWKEVLDRDVLPKWREVYDEAKPVFFHMTDFANPHSKIYGDWSEGKKEIFLRELHKIMGQHSMKRFATSIPIADYEELTDKEKWTLGHPHVQATFNCMKHIKRWADSVILREPIAYIFEQGSLHNKQLRKLFAEMTDEQEDQFRLGSVDFKNKWDCSPLQAADIIAVETRWEFCRQLNASNTRAARKSLLNLEVHSLDEWYYIDKKHFRRFFDDNLKIETDVNLDEILKEPAARAKKKGYL
jgi:hypothetical protein